jgi:hypothetical protein
MITREWDHKTVQVLKYINDDDVFYLCLQKQKIGAELHIYCIYLEEGTYHKRLFRGPNTNDNDVFYLFLQKQNLGAKLHIYLEEGTYPKRMFRGPSTNDMKK